MILGRPSTGYCGYLQSELLIGDRAPSPSLIVKYLNVKTICQIRVEKLNLRVKMES